MGSSGASKRIQKELAECSANPPSGMTVAPIEDSIYKWQVTIPGPEQSPYVGGTFKLHINLPTDYPFKPPVLSFQTKIYHPNISNDDKGSMCLGMLRSDQWKPPNKIAAVLDLVRNILIEPNTDDAIETSTAEQYKHHRDDFNKVAKEWTKKYASGH